LRDAQANAARRHIFFGADQAARSDARGLGHRRPAAVLAFVHRERIHALPQPDVFPEADHVERDVVAHVEHDVGGGDAIVGAPIAVAVAVEQIARIERLALPAHL